MFEKFAEHTFDGRASHNSSLLMALFLAPMNDNVEDIKAENMECQGGVIDLQ